MTAYEKAVKNAQRLIPKKNYSIFLMGLVAAKGTENPYKQNTQNQKKTPNWNRGRFLAWQKGNNIAKKYNYYNEIKF